ncbi:MAG TPA: hypothetical protein VIC84_00160 [Blastocatellia bacterium]|jgi:hypothetical protein
MGSSFQTASTGQFRSAAHLVGARSVSLKVEKTEGGFYAFRRFFGKTYIRNGGTPLYLQKVFGHSSLHALSPKAYTETKKAGLDTATQEQYRPAFFGV